MIEPDVLHRAFLMEGLTMRPLIIQGALPVECEHLASQLTSVEMETIGGWVFWKGQYQGFPVIISKTRMGMTNSAAATAIAILKYQPCAIINQGTSGGHDPALNVFDLVLGRAVCNIGAFKTPKKALGEGADALAWREAFDMLAEDETDPEPIAIRHFYADPALLAAAQHVRHGYMAGQVVEGIIGSADVWNNELDRIAFFRATYGTVTEEMEGASVAQVAAQFQVPFLAIRVVSNNLTNQQAYNAKTGQACQDFVFKVVQHYLAELSKN